MGRLISGYVGKIICPRLDIAGNDNTAKMMGLRQVIQANYGSVLQVAGTIYTYARTFDGDGNLLSLVETPLECFVIFAVTTSEALRDSLESYADMFSSALNVVCIATVEQTTFSIGTLPE